MSWRRSAGSTKRVVAQAPSVSGIGLGATSDSLVTIGSGRSTPAAGCQRLRIQWKPQFPGEALRTAHATPGGT